MVAIYYLDILTGKFHPENLKYARVGKIALGGFFHRHLEMICRLLIDDFPFGTGYDSDFYIHMGVVWPLIPIFTYRQKNVIIAGGPKNKERRFRC